MGKHISKAIADIKWLVATYIYLLHSYKYFLGTYMKKLCIKNYIS